MPRSPPAFGRRLSSRRRLLQPIFPNERDTRRRAPRLITFLGIGAVLPVAAIWLAVRQATGSRIIVGRRRATLHLAILGLGLVLPAAAIWLAFSSGWHTAGTWILGGYALLVMLQILAMRVVFNLFRIVGGKPLPPDNALSL